MSEQHIYKIYDNGITEAQLSIVLSTINLLIIFISTENHLDSIIIQKGNSRCMSIDFELVPILIEYKDNYFVGKSEWTSFEEKDIRQEVNFFVVPKFLIISRHLFLLWSISSETLQFARFCELLIRLQYTWIHPGFGKGGKRHKIALLSPWMDLSTHGHV